MNQNIDFRLRSRVTISVSVLSPSGWWRRLFRPSSLFRRQCLHHCRHVLTVFEELDLSCKGEKFISLQYAILIFVIVEESCVDVLSGDGARGLLVQRVTSVGHLCGCVWVYVSLSASVRVPLADRHYSRLHRSLQQDPARCPLHSPPRSSPAG